jgi:hypothetical protein
LEKTEKAIIFYICLSKNKYTTVYIDVIVFNATGNMQFNFTKSKHLPRDNNIVNEE